jgi:hypothetical protein
MTRGRTIGPSESFGFRAFAARLSQMRSGVAVKPGMCACSSCGLVWGELSTMSLWSHLEKFATGEARTWLRSANDTPL